MVVAMPMPMIVVVIVVVIMIVVMIVLMMVDTLARACAAGFFLEQQRLDGHRHGA